MTIETEGREDFQIGDQLVFVIGGRRVDVSAIGSEYQVSQHGIMSKTEFLGCEPIELVENLTEKRFGKGAANLPANLAQVEIASRTIDDPKGVKEV